MGFLIAILKSQCKYYSKCIHIKWDYFDLILFCLFEYPLIALPHAKVNGWKTGNLPHSLSLSLSLSHSLSLSSLSLAHSLSLSRPISPSLSLSLSLSISHLLPLSHPLLLCTPSPSPPPPPPTGGILIKLSTYKEPGWEVQGQTSPGNGSRVKQRALWWSCTVGTIDH